MKLELLEEKKLAIEKTFNELTEERKVHSDKTSEIDTELIRLQGEYRLVEELLAQKEAPKNAK